MDGLLIRFRTPLLTMGTVGFVGAAIAAMVVASQVFDRTEPMPINSGPSDASDNNRHSEYNKHLTDEQYHVTREKGTEPAFRGKYWNNKATGLYKCVCCGTTLFDSRTKFESGTGWPSFYQPVDETKLDSRVDGSLLTERTEVVCRTCKAHLGHVFEDGPPPTGLRYCINSAALDFQGTVPASNKGE